MMRLKKLHRILSRFKIGKEAESVILIFLLCLSVLTLHWAFIALLIITWLLFNSNDSYDVRMFRKESP